MTLATLILDAAETPFTGIRWTNKDLLDCLTMIRGLHNLLDRKEGVILRHLRDRHVPFQEIADALGVATRQAAEQRLLKLQAGRDEREEAWLSSRRRARLGMEWSPVEFEFWWVNSGLVGIFETPDDESDDTPSESPANSRSNRAPDG